MADKKCPRCGLWNSDIAVRCDCGYDFKKGTVEESFNTEFSKSSTHDAQNALISAIVGIFFFGIILEPISISLARKVKKTLSPGDEAYRKANTAEIIGWIALTLWVIGLIVQIMRIVNL